MIDGDAGGELCGRMQGHRLNKQGHGPSLQPLGASPRLPQMLTMVQPRAPSREPQTDRAKLLQPCSPPARTPVTWPHRNPCGDKEREGTGTIWKVPFYRCLSILAGGMVLEKGAGDIKIRKVIISLHGGEVLGSGERYKFTVPLCRWSTVSYKDLPDFTLIHSHLIPCSD